MPAQIQIAGQSAVLPIALNTIQHSLDVVLTAANMRLCRMRSIARSSADRAIARGSRFQPLLPPQRDSQPTLHHTPYFLLLIA
ncbi:uncharacterized protein SCHCODRAFT_02505913 [Schizophyllum commune H4-8]|uniref:uncharacterized protein n=1 Tax=Schizophyllum commune (strain H4-8 / FGSC 9210) TaxID=578458 RepID=UPI00215E240C|nr:uncharacterized protein SCHCODRAFT_02505913 [Schizophyllum commune H4-8]KAI5890902.1 hypothetical protein SCHCODRAFT_02505913 [Schizophyllum commune H4-8]